MPDGAIVRFGKGIITSNIAYFPDGTKLAVGSSTGIWIYDARIGSEIELLTGHKGTVRSLAFSSDGKMFASGELDGRIRFWDANTLQLKESLIDSKDAIFLEFSSNEKTLVSKNWDGVNASIKLWDITTGEYKHLEIDGLDPLTLRSLTFSPDGTVLAGAIYQHSSNPLKNFDEIRFWDSLTGKHKSTILGVGPVADLEFSPDGETIAIISHKQNSVHQRDEYLIELWDIESKELRLTFEENLIYTYSIKFSPDGKTIISGDENGEITFWNTATGQRKLSFKAHEQPVFSIAFSPYGGTIASATRGGGLIRFWDATTGKHKLVVSGHIDSVHSIDFSKDGKTLASGSLLGSIRFWDVEKARLKQTIAGLGYNVTLAYSSSWRKSSNE